MITTQAGYEWSSQPASQPFIHPTENREQTILRVFVT